MVPSMHGRSFANFAPLQEIQCCVNDLDSGVKASTSPEKQPKTSSSAKRTDSFLVSQTTSARNVTANKAKGCLKKGDVTPSRNKNFCGRLGGGDRFIPNRSATQFDFASHCLSQGEAYLLDTSYSAPNSPIAPEKIMKMQLMRARSGGEVNGEERILVYRKGQAPCAPNGGYLSFLKVLYCSGVNPAGIMRKGLRHIPTAPERVLDAPDLMDDCYLTIMDWGENNVIAVALTYTLYLWNAGTGGLYKLFELPEEQGVYISSVQWTTDAAYIAAGLSNGEIRLFDPTRDAPLRRLQVQINRVGCLAWRDHILSAGCRSGRIYNHDVRIPKHYIGTFENHTQEVCGLKWSYDRRYLASGGGDNLVNLWEPNMISAKEAIPLYTLDDHLATVKAIAFNPHRSHSLATGGGTNDRCVKTWNLTTGTLCHSEQTDSQIIGLEFSKDYEELVTAHGYPANVLRIWRSTSMKCIQELVGHTDRILGITASPDGQFIMSSSADESLRLWACFQVDKNGSHKEKPRNSRLLPAMVR